MPLYVYRCPLCDNVKEQIQTLEQAESQNVICDMCKLEIGIEIAMDRLISSNISVQFKGQGFYSTDNKPVEKIPRKVKDSEYK